MMIAADTIWVKFLLLLLLVCWKRGFYEVFQYQVIRANVQTVQGVVRRMSVYLKYDYDVDVDDGMRAS